MPDVVDLVQWAKQQNVMSPRVVVRTCLRRQRRPGNLRVVVIREMSEGDDDAVVAISYLFDDDARIDATGRFVTSPGRHLLVAYENAVAVGFVTGVEMTHADKGTDMFLYEIGVNESARNEAAGGTDPQQHTLISWTFDESL